MYPFAGFLLEARRNIEEESSREKYCEKLSLRFRLNVTFQEALGEGVVGESRQRLCGRCALAMLNASASVGPNFPRN